MSLLRMADAGSRGARNPRILLCMLRLLVSSLRLAPSGLMRRFAPGETVLRSDLPRLRHARYDF